MALIALARSGGFSLNEIAAMIGPDGQPRIDRQLLADKADELDRSINTLKVMRDGLRMPLSVQHQTIWNVPLFAVYWD